MKTCTHAETVVVYPDNEVCALCVANAKLDRKEALLSKLEVELDVTMHDLESVRSRELVK